jgi:uncharacterized membrane protein HdeD (DUF308 family)
VKLQGRRNVNRSGIVVLAFPLLATIFLVTLLAVGLLLFVGFARIIQGVVNKNISKWSRIFPIGVGELSLVVSFIVFASPLTGAIILTFILAINLLIIGIESIAYGISSRRTWLHLLLLLMEKKFVDLGYTHKSYRNFSDPLTI